MDGVFSKNWFEEENSCFSELGIKLVKENWKWICGCLNLMGKMMAT